MGVPKRRWSTGIAPGSIRPWMRVPTAMSWRSALRGRGCMVKSGSDLGDLTVAAVASANSPGVKSFTGVVTGKNW